VNKKLVKGTMMLSNITHSNTKRRMPSAVSTRDREQNEEWTNVYQWGKNGSDGCEEDMYDGHDNGDVDDEIEHDDDVYYGDDEGYNEENGQYDACSSSTVPSLSRTSCDSSSVCSSIATIGVGSKYATIRYDEKLIGLHPEPEHHERSLRRTIYEGEYNERVLLQESYRFRREKVIRQREQQLRLLEERGRNRRVTIPPSLPEEIAVDTCNSTFVETLQGSDGGSTVFERTFLRYYRGNDDHGHGGDDDDGFILGMELLMTTLVILVVVVAIILGLNGPSDD
jgi:hypothetical protein